MRQVKLVSDDQAPSTEENIFNVSDVLTRKLNQALDAISRSDKQIADKIQRIIEFKDIANQIILKADEEKLLKNYFSYDGWITLTEKDLEEITGCLFMWDDSWLKKMSQDIDNPYILSLYQDFCYSRWRTLNFRNENYYFLFWSVKLNTAEIGITTSINDYTITDIDIEQFRKDVYTHYNRVEQHLKLFLDFFVWMTTSNLIENFDTFKSEMLSLLNKEKIEKLELVVKNFKASPDEEFDKKILNQNLELIKLIKDFVKIINNISLKSKTLNNIDLYHYIVRMIQFMTIHSEWLNQIKNVFWIDINAIFRKYVFSETLPWIKKLVLGLLDAKINLLAFMQNITQILYNKNFLSPDFEWSLVFRKDQVEHMEKISPDAIDEFKAFQRQITSEYDVNRELAFELDSNIWYFCDILVWDKPESYIYATSLVHYDLKEIHQWFCDDEVELFKPTFDMLDKLLETVDKYWEALDKPKKQKYLNELERNKKKTLKWKQVSDIPPFVPWINKNYTDAKSMLLKKLIRFHREENNPLVIIKTAQNAYNHIINNWYTQWDSLHILNVNYWWSLVWYYAKHIFEKMQWSWRILVNIWNIVYSIYDLKNASDFLSIVDYPFNEYIEDFQSDKMKDFFSERNHLIIFDDNTSSWRTLNDLQNLGKQIWIYWKVDVFACRASTREDLYDDSVSDDTILNLISNSALETRKTRIWTIKRWYKELVWTYIWNTLYKTHFSHLKK